MNARAGLSFSLDEPAARVANYVVRAEELGFDGLVLMTDSQVIWRDVYVALTLAIERTKKVMLGTGVSSPATRHPTVIAGAMATLDELSGGRTVLGIGTGDSAVNTIHKKPVSLAELRRTVELVRKFTNGQEFELDGQNVRSPWANHGVPIYIGSTGPNSLRLAGAIADGVIVNVGAQPDLINWALEHLREGAASVGRSIQALDVWVRITCYPDPDDETARKVVGSAAAAKANGLARYAKDDSFRRYLSQDMLQDIQALSTGYNYLEHENASAKHASLVTKRIVDELVIAGSPDYCRGRLERIVDGTEARQFSFATYGFPDKPSFLRTMITQVLQ